MEEVYKQFRDTRYKISNKGNVIGVHGRTLKPQDMSGYRIFSCWASKTNQYYISIHIAVAELFIGEKPKGCEVNHKNGIKSDNRASNLEYLTHQDNALHAIYFIKSKVAKLTPESVLEILTLHSMYGLNVKNTALEYGVSKSTISLILNGRIWKSIFAQFKTN